MFNIKIIMVVIVFIIFPIQVSGDNIEYISSMLWNGANDIQVRDNYAYCAFINGLMIVDFSNSEQPVEISKLYLPGDHQNIHIEGRFAFLASGEEGLQIIDISDPELPTLLSAFKTNGIVFDVAVFHDYAFIADIRKGLYIVDFSNPEEPEEVYHEEISNLKSIDIAAFYLIVSSYSGVKFYDVSDPTQPAFIESIEIEDGSDKAFIDNSLLYVMNYWDEYGLHIFDISDIHNPQLLSSVNTYVNDFQISDNTVYIVNAWREFQILDTSDPGNPVELSRTALLGYGIALEVEANTAYIVCNHNGIYTYDLNDTSEPIFLQRFVTPKRILTVSLNNGLMYSGGFHIINDSDPSNPQILSQLQFPEWVRHTIISDTHAYLVSDNNILNIIEITNPFQPEIVGSYTTPQGITGIDISNNLIYISVSDHGIQVINISEPDYPYLESEYLYQQAKPTDLDLYADRLYLSDDSLGLMILDITIPTEPAYLTEFFIPNNCKKVSIKDDRAYLVSNSTYHIIDISDPFNPDELASWGTQSHPYDLWIEDDYAYLADGDLWICDISDLPNVYSIDRLETPGTANDVTVVGDNVYVADRNSVILSRFAITGIDDEETLPLNYKLSQNYPNPFNVQTNIAYDIPSAGNVRIDIYDILGRKVQSLINEYHQAGSYNVIWNANDFSSGVYLYKIQADNFTQTYKCSLIK